VFRIIFSALLLSVSIGPLCTQSAVAQEAKPTGLGIPETDEGVAGAGPIRRQDWFHNVWNKRREAWAKQVDKDQNAVVFLGDSITQGWGDKMRGAFGDLKVANRGISGDTTRGMLYRLDVDVLSLHPKAVVMLMGTNDLEENAEPDVIAGNIKLIVDALNKNDAKMPIVVCRVFPSSASKKRPKDKIQKINDLCAQQFRGNQTVTMVDTWTLFADENGDANKAEFPDLLHPNAVGYEKWGKAVAPIFATLGLTETEADEFSVEDGFVSLFNGADLTGWGFHASPEKVRKRKKNPNGPAFPVVDKAIQFDGKTRSNDGRYVAVNGRLVVTTPTEGRRIQQLWTTKEFGSDFVLKLEFRATPNADSGVFIRGNQLQCRDYLLAGPYKELKDYRAQDWNELVIKVTGETAHCTCNGELLEAEFKVPSSGPIGLEGDRGQIEYRRIRIQETNGK